MSPMFSVETPIFLKILIKFNHLEIWLDSYRILKFDWMKFDKNSSDLKFNKILVKF